MEKEIREYLIDHSPEIEVLSQKFSNYSPGISKTDVEHFISQFKPPNTYLGLKLLQNVDYYDGPKMTSLARDLGNRIKSISDNNLQDVLICPLKPTPGSSAHTTQRMIRQTISTTPDERQRFFPKFISYDKLDGLSRSTVLKKIFFVDDFIGSGDTTIKNWGRFQMLQNTNHIYHVGALVGYQDSIERIETETANNFEIVVAKELPASARAFHHGNTTFTENEKRLLQNYCNKIPNPAEHKYGHRNGQSLVIFFDTSPNNSLPILHKSARGWKPLFPRNY